MEFSLVMRLDDSFRDLIKNQRYEKYVFLIISKAQDIFQGKSFRKNDSQTHGECDFIDSFGEKYDAKLLIDEKQGKLIGERKNDIMDWIRDTMREINEYSQILSFQDYSFIPSTRLYSIMKERLESLKEDENALFFSPYPLVMDTQYSRFIQFGTDFLDAVYSSLKENGLVGDRKIYFIYPSNDTDTYVLRDANSCREYIQVPEIKPFISFETRTLQ